MHDYTGRDKKRFGDPNIKTTAYQQFVSALKRCRECLNGYDYSAFLIVQICNEPTSLEVV